MNLARYGFQRDTVSERCFKFTTKLSLLELSDIRFTSVVLNSRLSYLCLNLAKLYTAKLSLLGLSEIRFTSVVLNSRLSDLCLNLNLVRCTSSLGLRLSVVSLGHISVRKGMVINYDQDSLFICLTAGGDPGLVSFSIQYSSRSFTVSINFLDRLRCS